MTPEEREEMTGLETDVLLAMRQTLNSLEKLEDIYRNFGFDNRTGIVRHYRYLLRDSLSVNCTAAGLAPMILKWRSGL